MLDLDYDNLVVCQVMVDVGWFWLCKGVDGFWLDVVCYIYFDFKLQEGDCVVFVKNFVWWKQFMCGVWQVNFVVYVVGEVIESMFEVLVLWFGIFSVVFDFLLVIWLIDVV